MALTHQQNTCRRMRLPFEWSMQRELVWSWRAYWKSIAHQRSAHTYAYRISMLRKARQNELAAVRAHMTSGLKP